MGVFKGNGQRWVVQLLTDVITSQVEWRNRKEEGGGGRRSIEGGRFLGEEVYEERED